jgi:putative membrane protein
VSDDPRRYAPEPIEEAADATRRTRLANERTYLAWWRTGLTALAVSLAAGKVVPELSHTSAKWPYEMLGAGFALLGIACIGYGYRREHDIEEALNRGEFAPIDRKSSLLLTIGGVSLGTLTFVLILVRG